MVNSTVRFLPSLAPPHTESTSLLDQTQTEGAVEGSVERDMEGTMEGAVEGAMEGAVVILVSVRLLEPLFLPRSLALSFSHTK